MRPCWYLLQNGPDDLEWQRVEFILLEEVVEVLLQHLKHQAWCGCGAGSTPGPAPRYAHLRSRCSDGTRCPPGGGGVGKSETQTETDEQAKVIDNQAVRKKWVCG